MTDSTSHAPPGQDPGCPRCGGSGMLRHGDQRFRTCLECLGQGRLLNQPATDLLFRPLSAATSVTAAR